MNKVDNDILNSPNVKHYKDRYYASKLGKIYSLRGPNLYELQTFKTKATLEVKMGTKGMGVARVVWETFKGEIPEGHILSHKDGMATNCELHNLELITRTEWSKRLRGIQKRRFHYVRDLDTGKTYKDVDSCARATNYSRDYVAHICCGKNLPNRNKFVYVPRRKDNYEEDIPLYAYVKNDYLHATGTKEELCNKFGMTTERFRLLVRKDRHPRNEQMLRIKQI